MSRVRVEKLFRQSPERVFDAFLDPAHVGEWLFATPADQMEHVLYEARVGGRIEIFERRGEDLAEHHGAFVDITTGSVRPLPADPALWKRLRRQYEGR